VHDVRIDVDRVYTLGAQGVLHCLALDSGKIVWKRNVNADYKVPQDFFGTAGTPLIEGDLIVLVGEATERVLHELEVVVEVPRAGRVGQRREERGVAVGGDENRSASPSILIRQRRLRRHRLVRPLPT